MPAPLTTLEVEQLIELRFMLEDAQRRATVASAFARSSAIVALDAVVERASAMVLAARGLNIPKQGEDMPPRLKESLGDAWRPSVLGLVRQLHRARNLAQHEGVSPDRDKVPSWSAATQAYVVGLIDAQYGVDVRRIVLADAINDPKLREHIASAESALDQGNLERCAERAIEAYTEANRRWQELHSVRGRTSPFFRRHEVFDEASHGELERQIEQMRAAFASSTLSSDASEAAWFLEIKSQPAQLLVQDEAERLLAFAFQWVANFELAAADWSTDRVKRRNEGERAVRSGAGPAYVQGLVEVAGGRESLFEVTLALADVPPVADFDEWATLLGHKLSQVGGPSVRWDLLPSGAVYIYGVTEQNVTSLIDHLQRCVAAADSVLSEHRREVSRTVKERLKVAEESAAALRAVQGSFPSWVTEAHWVQPESGERAPRWEIRFSQEARSLRFVDSETRRTDVIDRLRSHDLVTQCFGVDDACAIQPAMDAERLLEVLLSVDKEVQAALEGRRAAEAASQSALQTIAQTIRVRLAQGTTAG